MAQDVEPITGTAALAAARLCNFATGGTVPLWTHQAWLDGTVRPIVVAHPNAWVDLIGYASKLGNPTANQRLSENRCAAVRGVIGTYSTTVGFPMQVGKGESESTGGERDDDGRWRAVAVFVYASRPATVPPVPPSTDPPQPIRDLIDEVSAFLRELQRRLPFGNAIGSALGVKIPTAVRLLNADEERLAFQVYGGSLDLTKIFLSDGLGGGRRPFTAAIEVRSLGWCVVLNVGDLATWHTRPRDKTLIHELAHAWQSQHHSDRRKFMVNSVLSQGLADADHRVGGRLGRFGWKASAYYYVPGKPFGDYAAEQIAEQIEHCFTGKTPAAGPIVVHVASLPPNVVDAFNVTSLTTPRYDRSTTAGVVT